MVVGRAWVGAAAVLAAGLLAASGAGPASASPAVAEGAARPALSTEDSAATAVATTSRLAGRNRVETAVLVSRRAFASAFTSGGSVYLARSTRVLYGGVWATSGSDLMADVVWEKAA